MRNKMPEFFIANIVMSFFNFVIMFFVFKFILSIFAAYQVYRKEKRVVSRTKEIGVNTNNDTRIKNGKGNNLEVVHDDICDTFVLKDDAYIAAIGDERHYFCSWECRQKYIDNIKKNKSV